MDKFSFCNSVKKAVRHITQKQSRISLEMCAEFARIAKSCSQVKGGGEGRRFGHPFLCRFRQRSSDVPGRPASLN